MSAQESASECQGEFWEGSWSLSYVLNCWSKRNTLYLYVYICQSQKATSCMHISTSRTVLLKPFYSATINYLDLKLPLCCEWNWGSTSILWVSHLRFPGWRAPEIIIIIVYWIFSHLLPKDLQMIYSGLQRLTHITEIICSTPDILFLIIARMSVLKCFSIYGNMAVAPLKAIVTAFSCK